MSELRFETAADAHGTAQAAAAFVAASARNAVAERGVFNVAFSGGSTPAKMLELLGEVAVPWEQVHVFQVDERIAPNADPARNLNMLEGGLPLSGRLPRSHLHAMPVDGPTMATDANAAAEQYARHLGEHCGQPAVLDLVHLGLGDDGHTASLVPGDAVLGITDRDVAITGLYRGHRRMTLTWPTLNRARCRLWLAIGTDKGAMLTRLRDADAVIPAGRVNRDNAVVFCDTAAFAAMS